MAKPQRTRERNVNVRASDAEYKRIQAGADRHGLTLSEYLRVLGSSEEWLIEQAQKAEEYQALASQMNTMHTPPWQSVQAEARERWELIQSILIVCRRMIDTALNLQGMLIPSQAAMEALLQRLDRLADAQRAAQEHAPGVSTEVRRE